MGKEPKQKFLQKRMQMFGEHMSRCLAAPVIRKVHLRMARMAATLAWNNYTRKNTEGQ